MKRRWRLRPGMWLQPRVKTMRRYLTCASADSAEIGNYQPPGPAQTAESGLMGLASKTQTRPTNKLMRCLRIVCGYERMAKPSLPPPPRESSPGFSGAPWHHQRLLRQIIGERHPHMRGKAPDIGLVLPQARQQGELPVVPVFAPPGGQPAIRLAARMKQLTATQQSPPLRLIPLHALRG